MFVSDTGMQQDRDVMAFPRLAAARILAALLLAACFVLLPFAPASADPPFDLRGPITDKVGALGGDQPQVETALKKFTKETGFQLFVVYVSSFDGMSGADWADETADTSGLGTTDILLAVATEDGRYGIAVPQEHALSDDDFTKVETEDIRPALQDRDFSGAAIAAAEGYTEAAEDSGLPWGAIVGGGVVVAGAGALLIHRTRRKYDETHVVLDEHGQPVDPVETLSTEGLLKRASAGLVELDDALKTSEQELGYAEAQFGKEATRAFAEALAAGRESAKKAFGIQQQLDDDVPDNEDQVRHMAGEIVHICDAVNKDLDTRVDEFDALRDLQSRAPEVLEDTAQRADETRTRLPAARTAIELLTSGFPGTNLASVTDNADQAEALLDAVGQQVEKGRTALASDDRATAVAAARAAEDAVAQAVVLLKAVDNAHTDLQAADAKITAGMTSLHTDVADAERLAQGDAGVTAAAGKARDAIAYAQSSGNDPLTAVSLLETAEATLDELLGPVRAAAAEAEKARTALTETLGRVTSQVKAVSDFIETRRGAVGAEARTRLSEAARLLDRAQQKLQTSPQEALDDLRRAEAMAAEAERLAQNDVKEWDRNQNAGSSGGGANSMVLGGILIDSLLRGGGGGGLGGILSGGSSSSGGGRSSRGPGSFGGSGTRSRRGGGGRF